MISNPAIDYHANTLGQSRQRTLNDYRVRSYVGEERPTRPPNSMLSLSGFVLVSVLAMGAFVMFDPFALFGPAEVKPAVTAMPPATPQTEPASPLMKETVMLQPAMPAAKSVEAPAAPASIVQAPRLPPPAAQRISTTTVSESRGKLSNKTAAAIVRPAPAEKAAPPPVVVVKSEEKIDAPATPTRGDEVKEVPKPAAAIEPPVVKVELPAVTEESN